MGGAKTEPGENPSEGLLGLYGFSGWDADGKFQGKGKNS